MQKPERNRKRSLIVNFRMSPEEREALESRIVLSGLHKQDYLIRSSLYQKIVVVGNERMFASFEKQLEEIQFRLSEISELSRVSISDTVSLRTICEIMEGLGYGPSFFYGQK